MISTRNKKKTMDSTDGPPMVNVLLDALYIDFAREMNALVWYILL
jgi:hypothetical protein